MLFDRRIQTALLAGLLSACSRPHERTPTPSVAAVDVGIEAGAPRSSLASGGGSSAASASIEADLGAIEIDGAFPKRMTVLGWTADHRLVYRQLNCDLDAGGGRGPYCELNQCAAEPKAPTPDRGETAGKCSSLLSLDVSSDKSRHQINHASVQKAAEDHLTELGPITAGHALPASVMDTTVKKGHIFVSSASMRGAAGVMAFRPYDANEAPLRDTKIEFAERSPDGACVGAVGTFVLASKYEGVPAPIPLGFGVVLCESEDTTRGPRK